MGRNKVRLELIINESVQKTTFRKRKAGLLKKASELTTLCGVQGCALIYGPTEPDQPYVWPSKEEAENVLERFKSLPPKKRTKHMINHAECLDNSLILLEGKVEEGMKKNRDLELEMSLDELMEDEGDDERLIEMMSLGDMKDLIEFLDKRLDEIDGGDDPVAEIDSIGGPISNICDDEDDDEDEEDTVSGD